MKAYVYVAVSIGTQVDWDSDVVYRFVDNIVGIFDSYKGALEVKHRLQNSTVYIIRKGMNSCDNCHYRLYEE